MITLGLDVETTGLDTSNDRILEFAWVLWDTDHKSILSMESHIVREDIRIPITKEITDLTGITKEQINLVGIPLSDVIVKFISDLGKVTSVVSHNGHSFDYKIISEEAKRVGPKLDLSGKVLIDTMSDLPVEAYGKSSSLTYMAADHGFVNPFPHRALTDVLTMMRLVSMYDFNVIYGRAQSPRVVVRACVSFDNKDLAKEQGFRWQEVGDMKFEKCWVKIIKECDLETLKEKCSFPIAQLKRL